MTDDLVTRLINPAGAGEAVALCREARKEIERLRAAVKEWACDKCSMIYPGPPQAGFACVICPSCGGNTMPKESLMRRRAEAERDALRKDAERYRWLHSKASWPWVRDHLWQPLSVAEFDAAIDAAMRSKP